MKRLFLLLVFIPFAISINSCKNNSNSAQNQTTEKSDSTINKDKAIFVEDILTNASEYLGKEIYLKGFIAHTCKHSGRRCFVFGKDQKTSIRVEAKGNIGGFNRELVGSEVIIRGILKESKITEEDIDNMELGLEDSDNGNSCDNETNSINSMREWMKKNNKDYYPIYYIDGLDYEVVQ